MDEMLTESAETVLADLCTPTFVRHVEHARDLAAGRDLWHQLEELGFLDALVPEARGGSGLTLAAVTGALFAFGRHALPLPAAQTMIARRLLATAGVDAPRGPIALAIANDAGTVFVPDGQLAAALIAQTQSGTRLVAIDEAEVDTRSNGLDMHATIPPGAGRVLDAPANCVIELGALVTAATMAGAMQRVLDLTVTYVSDRVQFGRAIGKFQAVQQQLSVMAEHVAATKTAAQIGCAAYGTVKQQLGLAIAKARASRAAPIVANSAHGLIGAMGITAEYDLQLYTRRLHAQRRHYGSESYWDEIVGAHAISSWQTVAGGVISMFGALDQDVPESV